MKRLLIGLICSLAIMSCAEKNKKDLEDPIKEQVKQQYKPTDKEVLMSKNFAAISLYAYASTDGKVNFAGFTTPIYYYKQIQSDYDANEVAADKIYLDKLFIVIGKISSIDRVIGHNYSIRLKNPKNQFMDGMAQMNEDTVDWLSQRKKGEEVALLCVGDGMLIGSSRFKECQPLSIYMKNNSSEVINKINEISFFVMSYALARLLPENSSCFNTEIVSGVDATKCTGDVGQYITNQSPKNHQQFIQMESSVINEMFH